MSLRDKIKREIVDPSISSIVTSAKGVIMEYNHISNLAIVKIRNPLKQGVLTYSNLPLPNSCPGISVGGPYRGDKVLLQFTSAGLKNPKIVGIVEDEYEQNIREDRIKHIHQGTYLPDGLSLLEKTDGITSDMVFDYYMFEGENERRNIQPIKELNDSVKELPYYDLSEVGLTHPKNKTTVKIKDDGSLDLFTWINQGVRINPIQKTILALSDYIKILSYKLLKLESKDKVEIIGRTIENISDFNIVSCSDMTVKSDNITIDSGNSKFNGTQSFNGVVNYNGEELVSLITRIAKKEAKTQRESHESSMEHGCNCE